MTAKRKHIYFLATNYVVRLMAGLLIHCFILKGTIRSCNTSPLLLFGFVFGFLLFIQFCENITSYIVKLICCLCLKLHVYIGLKHKFRQLLCVQNVCFIKKLTWKLNFSNLFTCFNDEYKLFCC